MPHTGKFLKVTFSTYAALLLLSSLRKPKTKQHSVSATRFFEFISVYAVCSFLQLVISRLFESNISYFFCLIFQNIPNFG